MIDLNRYPLLAMIDDPRQLRELEMEQLLKLADELRGYMIDVTSRTGGHLAPGLGTVELTIALHYVFDTPHDRLVWDIGHQAYPHKILTGRRDRFSTIRQEGGLSGFLKRSESEYDAFGAGHSSTSISAALGMAVATARAGIGREVIAVIGDGALTGGMAFEALNNAGDLDADLLVILNDNEMSISRNVGAISSYLSRILSGRAYTSVRKGSKTVLGTLPPPVWDLARRVEEHMKGMVMPSTLFEELGFNYIGPVDGHNLRSLVSTLRNMKAMKGPRFLHVATTKGRGYKPAEGEPSVFHGVSPFDRDTGERAGRPGAVTYTRVFGDWLCDMAERDRRLVAITPAMREGSGMVAFSKRYPARFFDVGIAEQHAVTFAGGLACEGLKPVVAIYSTFLQRGYDQLIHDVALQDLDVTFAIDRAGLVGADGATHMGAFDLSFLRCIPNMVVMAPADEAECRDMLYTAFLHDGPAAVRYPRGAGPGAAVQEAMQRLEIGRGVVRREGRRTAILAFGSMVAPALEAAEKLDATVADMRFVKPLDEELVLELAAGHDLLVTVEENVVAGGAGSGVNELLHRQGLLVPVVNLGLPDAFIEQGTQQSLLAQCGLDAEGIRRAVLKTHPHRPRVAVSNPPRK